MNRNVIICIGLFILAILLLLFITKNESDESDDTLVKPTREKPSGLPPRHTFHSETSNSVNCPKINEVYDQLNGLSIDRSIDVLRRKGRSAKRIVPDFPVFPKLWILPPTKKGKYSSLGERYCIEFLNLLFSPYKFKKIRPPWLRNPETNRCLELDGYCEELMIGVEYNGKQHYVWPNFTNCTEEEFKKQQYRDRLKEKICIERNICLIRVPYTVPNDRIPLAIYSSLLDGVPGLNDMY